MSPGVVNAVTDDMDDTRCADLQQAIDWTIKSELHVWTSCHLAKGNGTHSWNDNTTETGASVSSHATPGGDKQEEHATLGHQPVAK